MNNRFQHSTVENVSSDFVEIGNKQQSKLGISILGYQIDFALSYLQLHKVG
ncbi:hypothetical protein JCM19232_4007 [Vibrio ishigakensis]|uniref:Uncharacterized protein n=1 Tax=Vibrio ishigakensis TaxID=1481914 RepID=A0A0B8P2R7_9VIBR|nr:hypothetical protein JCM19232_4007 [Vibrio ishigakensis]